MKNLVATAGATKCDVCKRKLTDEDDRTIIKEHWGYFSKGKDLQYHECVICETCYDKVHKFIQSLGGKVRIYHYDIATGEILDTWENAVKKVQKANNDLRKASKIQRHNKVRKKKR